MILPFIIALGFFASENYPLSKRWLRRHIIFLWKSERIAVSVPVNLKTNSCIYGAINKSKKAFGIVGK